MASSPQLSRLAAGALLGAAVAAACFIEPVRPPAFRADCDSDSDCADDQACVAGLCELPCTIDLETFESDCPTTGDYLACINEVCVSACELDDPACPGDLSCVELDTGFGDPVGVCVRACTEDDTSACVDGEVCFEGACVATGGGDTDGDTDGGPP